MELEMDDKERILRLEHANDVLVLALHHICGDRAVEIVQMVENRLLNGEYTIEDD